MKYDTIKILYDCHEKFTTLKTLILNIKVLLYMKLKNRLFLSGPFFIYIFFISLNVYFFYCFKYTFVRQKYRINIKLLLNI